MSIAGIATIVYAILSIVGGWIGFQQAQSKKSLIAGIVSGGLLLVAALLMGQNSVVGLGLAIAVTTLLFIVFAVRLAKTRKLMPAGLMLVTGAIAWLIQLQAILQATP